MRILGMDTSSGEASLVLMEKGEVLASERSGHSSRHSRNLLKTLSETLGRINADPASLDIVAVASGPGSFTGLRIGLGTALGLGDALDVPVMGIGTLDAMARARPLWDGGYTCAVLNAGKGEVYAALYVVEGGSLKKVTGDLAVSPRTLAEMIDRPARFVGDGFAAYENVFREHVKTAVEDPGDGAPLAEGVARVASEEARAGRIDDHPPTPRYARRSQAEINWEKLHA